MATNVDRVLGALGDPTRRRIVQLLRHRPMRAGELAEAAKLSRPAMSRHLRTLLAVGIVSDERTSDDARLRIFRLRPERFVDLQVWLDDIRAAWNQQLRSFQRHVERKGRP
jgi:DNA-binding transcriptional ArsR family regulator